MNFIPKMEEKAASNSGKPCEQEIRFPHNKKDSASIPFPVIS